MDDDADEAVEPFEAELERGQAGLRGDRHRHLVADLEAARAGEFLLRQKERRHLAQLRQLGRAARGEERIARERQLPERLGDRPSLERARRAPAAPPAAHGAGAAGIAGGGRLGRDPLEAALAPAHDLGARPAAAVELPVAQDVAHEALARDRGCAGRGCGRGRASARRRRAAGRRVACGSTSMNAAAGAAARAGRCAGARRGRRRCARRTAGRRTRAAAPAGARPRDSAGRRRRRCRARRRARPRRACRRRRRRSGRRGATTPADSSIASPTRKSRLPGRNATVVRAAAALSTSTQRASKPRSAMSSPIQTSNRSPRMKTASARVCSMCAGPGVEHARRVLGQVQVGEQVDRAPVRRRN